MSSRHIPSKPRRDDWKYNIVDNAESWDDLSLDGESDVEIEEDEEELEEAPSNRLPSISRMERQASVPSRRLPPGCRYPVWERKVRLTGETRVESMGVCNERRPLIPLEVFFTSPPTLNREVIICGFVIARLRRRGHAPKRISLPFQATFTAWPVRDMDTVAEDFLGFDGARVCPVLATSPNGRVFQACDLKVAFDALVRVFHPLLRR